MLLWTDDFGRYGGSEADMLDGLYAQIDTGTNSWNLSTLRPRTGSYSFRLGSSTSGNPPESDQMWRRVFGSVKDAVGFGAAFYMDQLPKVEAVPRNFANPPAALVLFEIRTVANLEQITFICGTDGGIACYTGSIWHSGSGPDVGTLLGRSDPCITAASWNHVECYVLAGIADDGAVEVRVNGVTVLNLSGVTTCGNGTLDFSQLVGGQMQGNVRIFDNNKVLDMADLFAWDTLGSGSANVSFLGDEKAFLNMPTADIATPGYQDWGTSSGSTYYNLINEIPPDDDTTYIYTSEAPDKVGLTVSNLPPEAKSIRAVVGWCRAKKSDAGVCTLNIGVLSAGVEGWGPDIPLTTAEKYYESIFEIDPATGAPWTPAGRNAAKLIYKRVA